MTTMKKAHRARHVCRLAVALAVAAAFRGRGRRQRTMEVKIDNFTFNPQRITVKAGTTVTWINQDDIPHTVAANGQGVSLEGARYRRQVLVHVHDTGSYEYFCSLHPHMTGTIVVEAATGRRCGPMMQGFRRRSGRGSGLRPGAFLGGRRLSVRKCDNAKCWSGFGWCETARASRWRRVGRRM